MDRETDKTLNRILTDFATESEEVHLQYLLEQVEKKRQRKTIAKTGAALSLLLVFGFATLQIHLSKSPSNTEIFEVIQPTENVWTEITNQSKYTVIKTEAWEETLVSRSTMLRVVILDDFSLLQQFGDRPVMLVDSTEHQGKELVFLDALEEEKPL